MDEFEKWLEEKRNAAYADAKNCRLHPALYSDVEKEIMYALLDVRQENLEKYREFKNEAAEK